MPNRSHTNQRNAGARGHWPASARLTRETMHTRAIRETLVRWHGGAEFRVALRSRIAR